MSFMFEHWFEDEPADITRGELARFEACKMREATQEERDGIDQYIDSIAEPCADAISRQAVLNAISELNAISFYEAQEDSKECYYEIINAIKQLPHITLAEKVGQIDAGVFDKIRTEIMDINVVRDEYSQRQNDYCDGVEFAKKYVLQIIDKYKVSSTDEEIEE